MSEIGVSLAERTMELIEHIEERYENATGVLDVMVIAILEAPCDDPDCELADDGEHEMTTVALSCSSQYHHVQHGLLRDALDLL